MLEALIFVVFPFCMVHAAISDAVSMTIANRISIILVAVFAVAAPLTGMDWATYGWHFAAAALVLVVTFGIFALGAMGGGDAKLLAATSLWIGFSLELVVYLVYASMIGGLLTVLVLMYRSSVLSAFTGRYLLLRHFADTKVGIPYGVALGVAGLLVYPSTPMMQWALGRLTAI